MRHRATRSTLRGNTRDNICHIKDMHKHNNWLLRMGLKCLTGLNHFRSMAISLVSSIPSLLLNPGQDSRELSCLGGSKDL
jgi:hypothetical protein